MKVYQLIHELHSLAEQIGDVEVKIYSEDYCCDTHKIESVTEGWSSNGGWTSHDDEIGICITK